MKQFIITLILKTFTCILLASASLVIIYALGLEANKNIAGIAFGSAALCATAFAGASFGFALATGADVQEIYYRIKNMNKQKKLKKRAGERGLL